MCFRCISIISSHLVTVLRTGGGGAVGPGRGSGTGHMRRNICLKGRRLQRTTKSGRQLSILIEKNYSMEVLSCICFSMNATV